MDNRKLAAATAAVFTYIKTQEEAAYYAAQADQSQLAVKETAPQAMGFANIWGVTGRTQLMQDRSMLQMRRFK